jgi:hypothetical protein
MLVEGAREESYQLLYSAASEVPMYTMGSIDAPSFSIFLPFMNHTTDKLDRKPTLSSMGVLLLGQSGSCNVICLVTCMAHGDIRGCRRRGLHALVSLEA